ncbi:MAG: hypothetical protein IKQ30_16025 [Bacteroidales bacterium]|nr:hypothetical protein [Bacteroidales bacterium]MBR4274330.1 hypothetical protein [Bacteroidales bacterium]
MKKIFLTLLTIALCTAAYSQTVETIRKDYNAAKAYVQEMDGPDSPAQNRVRISTEEMYCGTGQHKETVTIYFRQDEENEEPCNKNLICFVTNSYNWAVREYYEEYLYDQDGNIEFIYAKDVDDNDFSETEYRIYYSTKGVIKLIVKHKDVDDTKFAEVYNGTTVAPKYKEKCDNYKRLSEHFKALYDQFIN